MKGLTIKNTEKILHGQSLAYELNRIYDNRFSEQTYAYRSNKSALNAVNVIDEQIRSSNYTYIMKADIVHFFDTIHWETLRNILCKTIKEEDVLFLIEENSKSTMLEDTGELIEKRQGIYQGSAISPILSNIYLMDFDNWLAQENVFYVRYADDMLLLGNSKEELLSLLKAMKLKLQMLGLKVNESKTSCVSLEEGINFLGYHFSSSGKAIPEKAEQELHERLEMMWLTSADISMEDKLTKAVEIIGGWEQYFREQREIQSIFEFVTLIYAAQNKKEYISELAKIRLKVENVYKDIAEYLAGIWRSLENDKMELLEYEQYYQIWHPDNKLEGKVWLCLSCWSNIES